MRWRNPLSSCSKNEPALLNRHWWKSRAGMGGTEAFLVCRGTPQGGKATGASSENDWTQAHYCTKDLRSGNESWMLLPHLQPPAKEGSSKDTSSPTDMHLLSFKSVPRSFSRRTARFYIWSTYRAGHCLQDKDIPSHGQQKRKVRIE